MALKKPVAFYASTIAATISKTLTTIPVTDFDDGEGGTLTGTKGFIIDEGENSGNSDYGQEIIIGTISGSNLINCIRGVSNVDGITATTALQKKHKRGASIKISNHPYILDIIRALNGETGLDPANIPYYTSAPSFTSNSQQLATVKLVTDTAIAGGVDASTSAKGISTLSVAPVSPTAPIAVGDNDPRVLSADDAALVAAITADAAEINKLDGFTGTASGLNDAVAMATAADVVDGGFTRNYTNGEVFTLPAGKSVAMKSDGNIELTGYSAFSTLGTPANTEIIPGASRLVSYNVRHFRKGTGRMFVWGYDSPAADMDMVPFTVNPAASATPSPDTVNSLNAEAGAEGIENDAIQLDTDKVLGAYRGNSGGTELQCVVYTLTDSGAATNGTVNIVASGPAAYTPNGGIRLAKISATQAVVFYFLSGTGLVARILTISGTTITAGAAQTVIATANTLVVHEVSEYVGSSSPYYMQVWYADSTAGTENLVVATLTGSTLAAGTPITVASAVGLGEMIAIDATTVLWAHSHSDSSVSVRLITRAGTVPTVGTATVMTASDALASSQVTIEAIGDYTYVVGYCRTGTTTVKFGMYEVHEGVITATGAIKETATDESQFAPRASYYAPGILFLGYMNYDSGSTDDRYKVVTCTMTHNFDKAFGVTQAAIAPAASGAVGLGPRVTELSGLTPGSFYYPDIDGDVYTSTATPLYGYMKSLADTSTSFIKRD